MPLLELLDQLFNLLLTQPLFLKLLLELIQILLPEILEQPFEVLFLDASLLEFLGELFVFSQLLELLGNILKLFADLDNQLLILLGLQRR